MTHIKHMAAIALLAAATATPALAKQRAISIPAAAIEPLLGAALQGGAISLPDAGAPLVSLGFRLPPDYKPGTVVKLRLQGLFSDSCAVVLDVETIIRLRNGREGYGSTERITPLTATIVSPGVDFSAGKTFEIRSPLAGPFKGQKPGDTFIVKISRNSGHTADTCVNPFRLAVAEVRYTYLP
jgi:hypothetical protein